MSSHSLTGFNDERRLRDAATLVTPTGESIDDYGEAKLTTQWRSIKKRLGLGTIFLILTGIASSTIAIEQLVAPAVGQSRWNGETDQKLSAISTAQKESEDRQNKFEERQNKFFADALKRIEDMGAKNNDINTQNRDELRSLRASTETAVGQLRQDTMGLWKWSTAIDKQLGELQNEIKRAKEK